MNKSRSWLTLCGALLLTSCGNSAPTSEEVGTVDEALAPEGSDAQPVSNTIPASMFPGERRLVSVTMQNTGASPANTWTTANPTYALRSPNMNFGWSYTAIPAPVSIGSNGTFGFIITAPATSDAFQARMIALGQGFFGSTLSVPVTVDSSVTPQWGCTFLPESSFIPTTIAPGANQNLYITVQNTGTAAWASSGFGLVSEDGTLWGQTSIVLPASVAPGGTYGFGFSIRAPTTPGSYTFTREMANNVLGHFRGSNPHCVAVPITVGGSPALDATVAATNFASPMAPGETRTVTVTMNNTGTETWQTDGSYMLFSENSPVFLWGVTQSAVRTVTPPGSAGTLTFNVTAPSTPGTYAQKWQMRKTTGMNAGVFGAVVNVPITVDTSVTPLYGATLVSENLPRSMAPGASQVVSITMRNSGSKTWSSGSVLLNASNNTWGLTIVPLASGETVAPGASGTFSFVVKAPATAGDYPNSWRMRSSEVGMFGDRAMVTTAVGVVPCTPTKFISATYRLDVMETTCTSSYPDWVNQCSSARTAPTLEIMPWCAAIPIGACTDADYRGGTFLVRVTSASIPFFGVESFTPYIPDATKPVHINASEYASRTQPLSGTVTFDLDPTTGVVSNFTYGASALGVSTIHQTTMTGSGSFVCDSSG